MKPANCCHRTSFTANWVLTNCTYFCIWRMQKHKLQFLKQLKLYLLFSFLAMYIYQGRDKCQSLSWFLMMEHTPKLCVKSSKTRSRLQFGQSWLALCYRTKSMKYTYIYIYIYVYMYILRSIVRFDMIWYGLLAQFTLFIFCLHVSKQHSKYITIS